jgi:hypothetical protein
MYAIKGRDLPVGTVVYWSPQMGVYRTELATYLNSHIIFVFDPNDGLFASEYSREYWRDYPYRHPHCTLFQMIYNKLGN